jgi:hypothetical protein
VRPADVRTDLADVTLYMNDLHILDTSSKPPTWSRPPRTPSNPAPIEREGHTAVVIGRSMMMVIFGGTWVDEDDQSRYLNDVHVLDASRNWWSQPDTLGTPPIEREGHTASAFNRLMLVFGGAGLDSADHSINLAGTRGTAAGIRGAHARARVSSTPPPADTAPLTPTSALRRARALCLAPSLARSQICTSLTRTRGHGRSPSSARTCSRKSAATTPPP